jgi:hypothetical protein
MVFPDILGATAAHEVDGSLPFSRSPRFQGPEVRPDFNGNRTDIVLLNAIRCNHTVLAVPSRPLDALSLSHLL